MSTIATTKKSKTKKTKEQLRLQELPNPNEILPNPYKGIERPNYPITDIEEFKKYFNDQTKRDEYQTKKVFCVMQFFKESEIGAGYIDDSIDQYVNTYNAYFHSGPLALDYYANTPCPASQLIDAETIEDLVKQRNEMLINMNTPEYLEEHVYPYL